MRWWRLTAGACMCDYCDCRSHPAISALSADHEVLLDLLDALRESVAMEERVQARVLVVHLHDVLHDHATREERGVFTQLRRELRDETYVTMFERDHEVLHGLLDACAGDAWQQAARELVELLREHILREETDLFPAAHQMLEPSHWNAVDAAVVESATSGRS